MMLTSGCHRHQVIPDSLKAHVNQAVTFDQVKNSPSSYQGELVVLGGKVLSVTRGQGTSCIEVLQLPLTDDLVPMMERTQSEGRFMVFEAGQESLILKEGTLITIVGEVQSSSEGHAGECQYEFPTLVNREMTVWEKNKTVSTPLTYYGSPYGYGFRPYYFSGIYGVHGLD
ncbi:MAG TPA: Slp family lipoprotein [Nitrospiraceae bacterium]|nr:Slp family lipoprotein [Nitrospiraceae bacterium]